MSFKFKFSLDKIYILCIEYAYEQKKTEKSLNIDTPNFFHVVGKMGHLVSK